MTATFTLWCALAALVTIVWIATCLGSFHVLRRRQILTPYTHDGPPRRPPKISVIVAARNETDNIEACLQGWLAQDYPDFEVIAVDDRSTDDTWNRISRLAKTHERLKPIQISSLPDGWMGKSHAMSCGVKAARGDWFLFTDADCIQDSTDTLAMASREAEAHESDFLCITPTLVATRTWERIIQPACTLALMIWFQPQRVNKPKRATAYANGAFMLIRRGCYESIGGHAGIRDRIGEDIALARKTKRAGFRLRVVEDGGLYHTRMYDSPGQAWHGWVRILSGSLQSPLKQALSALLIFGFVLLPWVSLVIAGAGMLQSTDMGGWRMATLCWLVAVLVGHAAIAETYRILRCGVAWSLTLPIGGAVVVAMHLSAMLHDLGLSRLHWKGVSYGRQRGAPDAGAGGSDSQPSKDAAAVADVE